MKRKINIILSVTLAVLAIGITTIGLIGEHRCHQERLCCGIDVLVPDYPVYRFVSPDDVISIVSEEYGGYLNRPVDSVNTHRIEQVLLGKGIIKDCIAYFTNDGILHVEAWQSTPVAALKFTDAEYYLDNKGNCFPVKEDWCTNAVKVYGMREATNTVWNARIAAMAQWIKNDSNWQPLVEKLVSDDNGNISVCIKGKNEIFLIGQPVGHEKKFGRIGQYLDRIGSDKEYKSVNVKYKGQIVCK